MPGVRADGLAEVRLGALDVEDVVDDLEQQAELAGEAPEGRVDRRGSGRASTSAQWTAQAIRRPVLRACTRRRAAADSRPASLRSRYWPPTIPPTPVARLSSSRIPTRTAGPPGWRSATRRTASAKSASPARIAVSSPKSLWQVGRPAAQVVVVHRRQVVVDERVGVHQLEGRRGRAAAARAARRGLGGRERQDRPDALAAGEQRVPHRLDEALGARPSPRARAGRWPRSRGPRGSPRPCRAGARGRASRPPWRRDGRTRHATSAVRALILHGPGDLRLEEVPEPARRAPARSWSSARRGPDLRDRREDGCARAPTRRSARCRRRSATRSPGRVVEVGRGRGGRRPGDAGRGRQLGAVRRAAPPAPRAREPVPADRLPHRRLRRAPAGARRASSRATFLPLPPGLAPALGGHGGAAGLRAPLRGRRRARAGRLVLVLGGGVQGQLLAGAPGRPRLPRAPGRPPPGAARARAAASAPRRTHEAPRDARRRAAGCARALPGGRGADVVVEAVGRPETWRAARRAARARAARCCCTAGARPGAR